MRKPDNIYPIYAEWTLLPQLFRRVHFEQKGHWIDFIITMLYINSVFNANSVDPDQTPQNAASDLGRHCLPMSLFMGR